SRKSIYLFCQAEDGLRDFHVTVVQTCARPIYVAPGRRADPIRVRERPRTGREEHVFATGKLQSGAGGDLLREDARLPGRLPVGVLEGVRDAALEHLVVHWVAGEVQEGPRGGVAEDRKSTRLNS